MAGDAPDTNSPPDALQPAVEPTSPDLLPEPPLFKMVPEATLPRRPRLWSLNDLVIFLALAALALLVSNFLAVFGYVALMAVAGWRTPPELAQRDPIFLLTLQFIFYGLLFVSIYVLVTRYHRQPFWESIHWKAPGWRGTAKYFLGGIALALFVQLVPTVLPDKQDFPLEQMFTSPHAAYAVAAFATLVAPFMEELVFRGVLFPVFELRAGLWFAMVATAMLFAGLHIPEYRGAWNHMLLIFFVGMVFSLARGLTGSLAASFILHFAYNTSLMSGLFFQTHHFRQFSALLIP